MFHDELLKTRLFWGRKVKVSGHNVCAGLQTQHYITADSYT